MVEINDPIQPGAEQILLPGLLSLPRPHRSPSLDHLEGKESQPPIRRNRKNNLQENRSAAAEFRQKPLFGKAQSPISLNALEILHGRLTRRRDNHQAANLGARTCGEDSALHRSGGRSYQTTDRIERFLCSFMS